MTSFNWKKAKENDYIFWKTRREEQEDYFNTIIPKKKKKSKHDNKTYKPTEYDLEFKDHLKECDKIISKKRKLQEEKTKKLLEKKLKRKKRGARKPKKYRIDEFGCEIKDAGLV